MAGVSGGAIEDTWYLLSPKAIKALQLDPTKNYYHREPEYTGVLPITTLGMGLAILPTGIGWDERL